ncbi:MAG: hypothetical protein KGN00_11385 [Chloroflexota bacterium]|nr:hypothetical protein [Chloroflexota bacterium]MDE3194278.1 hypothetical protein [Chloroflexota bacterium]
MAKMEERPVDSGVWEIKGLDETAAAEWWKKRFALVASIPNDVARAGALLPQMRQLSRLLPADRRRLTKARMQAFLTLAADQRQRITSAKKVAMATDPELVKSDDAITSSLVSEIPGAQEAAREMGA